LSQGSYVCTSVDGTLSVAQYSFAEADAEKKKQGEAHAKHNNARHRD